MICENFFCIYWLEDMCQLSKITLNIQGVCQECIYLDVPKEILDKERNKILKNYKKQ